MTIAAHIPVLKDPEEDSLFSSLLLLAAAEPDHHFILFFDGIPAKALPENCTPVPANPSIRNSLLLHYWYNFKLPKLLLRYGASLFISKRNALSLRTSLPQLMLVSKLPGKAQSQYGRYITKYFPAFIEKAAAVLSALPHVTEQLSARFSSAKNKISSLPRFIHEAYQPLTWQEKETNQQRYSLGKEYFVFVASAATVAYSTALLKAFSRFKKWQKSGIRMVILLDDIAESLAVKDFNLYKFREEVSMIRITDHATSAAIIGSAFAMIQPDQLHTGNHLFHGLSAGIPVIGLDTPENRTDFSNAILYSSADEKSISQNMIRIYQDEHGRAELLANAANLAAQHTPSRSAQFLWEKILAVSGV
ncbi:MAG: glycosyltransferase family 4 protein [Ferruginibacter sp.]|nr:glycosyltransferase family 4 protein [Ferruginibacter sp.]